MDAPPRPRGRPPSRAWAFFSTITEPQKQLSTLCRHCNQLVLYHKKWAQARAHLMKCPQFLQMIDTLPPSDVPEWYLAEINRRQQSAVLNRSRSANISAIFQQNQMPTQASTTPFKVIQPIPVPMAMATMMPMPTGTENMAVKNGINTDWKKVEENVAMHLFMTMQMELLLEEKMELPFLLQAFQACNGNSILPSKEKLLTELLDRCYDNVKTRMLGFFKSGLVPVTLSVDTEGDEVVTYMATQASSEKHPMYLESVKIPSSGDADANAELAARDLARIVDKMSSPVAGCVMPCSTVESRQTRELLEKQFPVMYFHGCMRDALLSLVGQIFAGNKGPNSDRKRAVTVPFAQDLQQFALQCQDLAFFLPQQEQPTYSSGAASNGSNVVHVTARRRLTVEEGFAAILQAEPFLNVDSVLSRLGNGSNRADHPSVAHFQTQLVKIVRSPQFVEKLGKYLELFRPIHSLLSALNDATPLLLSEIYSSFSRLVQQFGSNTSLQPEEKAALQALVRRQQDSVMGSAHLLAYLLDPVLLGEDLPADTKTEVEQKLMASLRGDGTQLSVSDKEALYTQYVDFKKNALNQKTNKADTLAFRALKERKKSPLQFWFADGSKWPVLQAIACRIFVMPVCAASSARAVAEAGAASSIFRQKTNLLTSDKLTFVRLNSRQLRLAEAESSSLAALVKKAPTTSKANEITASMVV